MRIVLLFALFLLPLVFVRGGVDAFEPHKVALAATAAAVLAALALARLFARAESQGVGAAVRALPGSTLRALREGPAGSAILLFLASSLLSTLFSINPALSLHGSSGRPAGLLTALALATFFFASRRLASEPRWFDRVALAATLAAAAASAYAVAQFLGFDPIGWSGAATFDGKTRVSGTLGHPNTFGAYLAMALPLTFCLASRTRSLACRASALAVAALSIFVLAATLSRGAWLGAAAAIVAFAAVWLLGSRQRDTGAPATFGRWRIGAIVLVALLAFLLPLATPLGRGFVTRIREVADLNAPTTQSRVHLWRAGLDMLSDRPLLGAGTDAFGVLFPRYRTAEFSRLEWNATTDKAHNEVIQIAATQGFVGIATALLVFFFVARATLRVSRRQGMDDRLSAAVAAASLAAWGVSSATGFSVAATGSLAAVVAGWAAGRARNGGGEIPVESALSDPPRRPTLLAWAEAALLVTGLWLFLVLPGWSSAFHGGTALALPDSDARRVEGLERAAAIAPWEARWSAELGRTYLTQAFAATDRSEAWQQLGGSRGAYEQAVRVAPENPEYRAYLARVLAEQASTPGRTSRVSPGAAESALAAAMAADPHGSTVLVLVTQGYLRLGLLEKAHHAAHRAAWIYPDFAVPMLDIGSIALEEGRYEAAADTLYRSLGRSFRDVPWMEATARGHLAYAYLQLGRYSYARDEAMRALLLDPRLEIALRTRDEAERLLASQ